MISRFPLQWPEGVARRKWRTWSRFKTTFAEARDGAIKELEMLGATGIIISSNVETRRDGLPYANQPEPKDPAVAVYFTLDRQPRVLACDRWDRVRDNLQAIRHTVEAMRGIDRWGCSEILERMFQGFSALPETARPLEWWQVLNVDKGASKETVESVYRNLVKQNHPDVGGSAERMAEINRAMDKARKWFGAN